MDVVPVTLEGALVRLEPLNVSHAEGLLVAAQDANIWRYLPLPMPETIAAMRTLIESALELQTAERELPFAIIERTSNTPVGSSRYMSIMPADRGLEIGW